MTIYADSPEVASHVIKCHRGEDNMNKSDLSVICYVANLIANASCRDGVANHEIHAACPLHPLSGLQRLRELAKRCRLTIGTKWPGWAYHYHHNRYYPTAAFKKFCRRFLKERLASS